MFCSPGRDAPEPKCKSEWSVPLFLLAAFIAACWETGEKDTLQDGGPELGEYDPSDDPLFEGPDWIPILGGTYEMGGAVFVDEYPVHSVAVGDFQMLKTEVTFGQYRVCVEADDCEAPAQCGSRFTWREESPSNLPINCVTAAQAMQFCAFVEGRLPSEAQWEYAARGQGQSIVYPWGDDPPTCDLTVMAEGEETDNVDPEDWGCKTGTVHPVCSRPAGNTEQGLCDMAGNLYEWVQDSYHDTYEGAPDDGSAWESEDGETHVTRGGCFYSTAANLRAGDRASSESKGSDIGFRCVRD